MNKIGLISVLLIISIVVFSQEKSYKRGFSYGFHSISDMQKASVNISWWYNWATLPEAAIRNRYQIFNVDFTPMVWNASAISGVSSWADNDSTIKYLLGFNEPNFKEQSDMTPTQAAKAWPSLQFVVQKHDLKIVSPSVNYCGNW